MDLLLAVYSVIVLAAVFAGPIGIVMISLDQRRATGIAMCGYTLVILMTVPLYSQEASYNANMSVVFLATSAMITAGFIRISDWLESRIGEDELDDDTFEESEEETDLANKRLSDVTI